MSQISQTSQTSQTLKKPYKLVIVESPSKCEKIEHYLGSDYKCIQFWALTRAKIA